MSASDEKTLGLPKMLFRAGKGRLNRTYGAVTAGTANPISCSLLWFRLSDAHQYRASSSMLSPHFPPLPSRPLMPGYQPELVGTKAKTEEKQRDQKGRQSKGAVERGSD